MGPDPGRAERRKGGGVQARARGPGPILWFIYVILMNYELCMNYLLIIYVIFIHYLLIIN